MPDTTIYLKQYQPPRFAVKTVHLNFALYEDYVLVTSALRLIREHPGALELFGEELELIGIEQDGVKLEPSEYRLQNGSLIIDSCPNAFNLRLTTKIFPKLNTKLSGLYCSKDLFCTQCEAEGFRRMTYFLDRPDVLSTYTTRISADKKRCPTLLSNGNLVETGESPDGRHWAVWNDPFKKPSYLFALVAGDLALVRDTFRTLSGRKIDLHLFVERGNEDKCQHALNSLKKAMAWDEEVYGREYDLNTYMIVAVSDFNMGAMENKGLNLFNSKYVLAKPDTATDQDFIDIEGVVGHEYFHNWTGNRVTCRDWFQLSLKEGLTVFRDQEFTRDMNSKDVFRIMDVKALRTTQFPEDSSAMAHPVRPESYREINNFYTATIYNKGAEIIRMQETLLGKEGFQRGMSLYFERHDGQAVTIDDFVAAMADANSVDLDQFKLWYSQAGTPEVRVKKEFSKHTLRLHFEQTCPQTPDGQTKRPFHIPIKIALLDAEGKALPLEKDVLELTEKEQSFTFNGLNEKPFISLLREFSAPILLEDGLNQNDLLFLLRHETDGFAKWDAAQRLILHHIHHCLKSEESQWQVPPVLMEAFEPILVDENLDSHLRAEILTLLSFEEIAIHIKSVNVDAVEEIRDSLRKQLGLGLQKSLLSLYHTLWEQESHKMDARSFGHRKLRNLCLWFLMKANEAAHLELCTQQFKASKTMTDQLAGFSLLVNCTHKEAREKAIASFYSQWSNDELVMDKWFAAQASCELESTLQSVKTLLEHPLFSIKNPNRVRALIGSFCLANPRHFHAADGSGYAFLAEMLRVLDKINPQVAARLASPFTRWQRFDKPRRAQMYKQLESLAQADLSRDLKEIVDKSLVIDKV